MVNPPTPWPRPETPRSPLDPTANETLELWAAQPEWDMRSLEEFAADGGRPACPPNRSEVGNEADGLVWLALAVGRALRSAWELVRLIVKPRADDRGRFYEMPALPRFVPAPPPPSTPMATGYLRSSLPLAPIGGTGETRGRSIIINDPTLDPVQVLELNRRRDARQPESGGGWPT